MGIVSQINRHIHEHEIEVSAGNEAHQEEELFFHFNLNNKSIKLN
jgi:hypothetical protein